MGQVEKKIAAIIELARKEKGIWPFTVDVVRGSSWLLFVSLCLLTKIPFRTSDSGTARVFKMF